MGKNLAKLVCLAALSCVTLSGQAVHAADASIAPTTGEVTVTNSVGKADTIYVSGVTSGDVVTVYNASTGGKVLVKKTVSGQKSDITLSVSQLGASAGSVYISVTSSGMTESSRTKIDFDAEGKSDPVLTDNVTITNYSGKADTIYVSGLASGDKVKIYNKATGGKLLCTGSVGSNKTEVTMSISQLGVSGGSVYATVTSPGMLESDRVELKYEDEDKSERILPNQVTITNNYGKADTIDLSGLAAGDKVKIYTAATNGKVIGSTTVGANKTDASISISQLGTSSGYVYISVTSPGLLESDRTAISFDKEGQSSSAAKDNITITNNSNKADTICVANLDSGDKVNVYNALTGGKLLGSSTAGTDGSATISIAQLGSAAGKVYISITTPGMQEGTRIEAAYDAEILSNTLDSNNIVATNNSGASDTVYVSGVTEGDTVKVYSSATGTNLLGSATVTAGALDATVSIKQLGTSEGKVYVSVVSPSKTESSRVEVSYDAEVKSTGIDDSKVTITNNTGVEDTIQISGLSANDVIKVYNAALGGSLLGSGTVSQYDTTVTIKVPQLGIDAGDIYISRTNSSKQESSRVKITFSKEAQTDGITAAKVSIVNNAGTSDTVRVTGLTANDVIKVYDLAIGGTLLGSATVASSDTEATATIKQLGSSEGSVYVSRTGTNKAESERIKVDYTAEPRSTAPTADKIITVNNAGIADNVRVTGLSSNDIVKIYDANEGGNLIGTATVDDNGTEAAASIKQLGTDGGNIYVSVTSTGKLESTRTSAGYLAEVHTTAPKAASVNVVNNAGIASTVTVNNLSGNDIVKVYDDSKGTNLLGSGTAGAYDSDVTISISSLNADGGYVYVSVTSSGKLESDKTEAKYAAKTVSNALNKDNVTIVNNAGIKDTIKVVSLQPNDIVKVYDSSTGGTLLGSVTVGSDDMEASLSITQLGVGDGTVYVSVTSKGKLESARTPVTYVAEAKSDPLNDSDIVIENNSGTADIITVTGVTAGDVVKVYNAESDGTLLGSATVASGDSEAVVSVSQLGTKAGNAYVSIVRRGKTESNRIAAAYVAESTAPLASDISISNNAVIGDTVTIKGLTANDYVRVYDASSDGTLLGSAVVAANSEEVTISISQLSINSGSVYVSVANFGKSESKRTKADYIAEQTSTALTLGNIAIQNNTTGTPDVITVSNLSASDVIRVYDATSGGNLIGTATVSSSGNKAVINIPQLGTSAGKVYITVTSVGKNESSRTSVGYTAEN